MIWRKMDWISDWISASVFSGGGAGASEAEMFSLSVDLLDFEDLDLEALEKISTCE